MQSLRLYFLCNKIAISSLNHKFHAGSALLVRGRRGPRLPDDPGLRHQKALHEDDPEYLQNLENEEDPEAEEINFMKIDRAYDEHFREKKRERALLGKKITVQKFFSLHQQPPMLTSAEKETIRFLHKKDPVKWDVITLSENFPALPNTISKIIRNKAKIPPEKQRIKDENVQKNWELLEKGKLDADPHVIKHLKKFQNRRQGILDQLKNEDLYLPEVKDEPVWNNGEMNSVLSHYEKLIENLQKVDKAMLSDGRNKEKNLQISDGEKEKSSLDMIHEKIEEERKIRNLEGEESFTMGEMFKSYKKELTFEELQNEIINKAETQKSLHLSEKAILESKLGISSYNKSEPAIFNAGSTESEKPQKNKLNTRNENKNRRLPSKMFEKETTIKEIISDKNEYKARNEREDERLRKTLFFLTMKENRRIPPPDKNTVLVSESEIGKVLNETKEPEPISEYQVKEEDVEEKVEKEDVEAPGKAESQREMRERLHYEKEERDIKNTPFWNNHRSSKEKALAEFEKAPLGAPKDLDKVTQVDVSCHDRYPERIDIPKSKRGSGLTFKVKDCYYDDDGEFLYRVPGMTK